MRILHLTSHMNVGGITTTIVNLSEAMAARGHQVRVASGGGALVARLTSHDIPHWSYPSMNTSTEFSPAVWWAGRRVAARLQQEPVDLIHAHTRVAQVLAERIWRAHHLPYVTTWHGFYRARLWRRLYPCTGAITMAISEPVARHLAAQFHVPATRIRLVPQAIDITRFESPVDAAARDAFLRRWQLTDHDVIVGTVARLVPSKGVGLLVESFAVIRAQIPEAVLLIVGDGDERSRLEAQARARGIQDSVRLVGSIAQTQLPLSLMRVFVFLPAIQEGFGLSLLEAMASGRPIVAVRRGGGSTWVLDESRVGVVTECQTPEALAEAVVRVLRDGALADRLGREARAVAHSQYAMDRMVKQVETVYHECIVGAWHHS